MKYIRNMKATGYATRTIDNGNIKAFRLYRGDQATLVPISELHYLVREYSITQRDLMDMVHLSDIVYGTMRREIL